jgi:hypothetical protein
VSLPELAINGVGIVILGRFTPKIFSPGWLATEGLLGKEEAISAQLELIVPNASIFTAAWLRCEVTDNRLAVSTSDPLEFERLRDVALGVLSTSPHPPVAALGLNRDVHFAVPSAAEWHAIGDQLSAKGVWDGTLKLPGTRSLVLQGIRPDNFLGYVQITVEPSMRMPMGVYVQQNDHYLLRRIESQAVTREDAWSMHQEGSSTIPPSPELISIAKEILTSKWADSMQRAEAVIERVWQLRG